MFINQKGSPFYIFRHCAAFSERKNFRKFQVFFQKNVLRFLSLRYSADLRRSRLVLHLIKTFSLKTYISEPILSSDFSFSKDSRSSDLGKSRFQQFFDFLFKKCLNCFESYCFLKYTRNFAPVCFFYFFAKKGLKFFKNQCF